MATSLLLDLGFGDAEEPTPGIVTRIVTPFGAKNLSVENVKHDEVHPDPGQPRKHADTGLWRSVAMNGIIQPLTVRPCPATPFIPELGPEATAEDRRKRVRALSLCSHCARPWAEIAEACEFMLVDGERRWRAAGGGVQSTVPVIVRVDQEERGRRLLTQAAANTGKPLSPIEEAELYAEALAGDATLTHAIVADVVGKSRSSVTDRLALLKNAAWVPLLRTGEISVSQALELSRHADAYPEVHEAAIAYMRRGAELDDVSKIADIELVEFRQMLERAYADHTEVAALPTVAPRVERAQRAAVPEREPEPIDVVSQAARDEHLTDDQEQAQVQESEAETGRKGREPLREAVGAVDHASASPSVSVPADPGLFGGIAALIADRPRPFTIMIAPGTSAGTLRVNLIPSATVGQSLPPLTLDGTPADLDAGIAEAIGEYRPRLDAALAKLAAAVGATKPGAPKAEKASATKGGGKTVAKKTAAKTVSAKKTAAKKPPAKEAIAAELESPAPVADPAQTDLVEAIAADVTPAGAEA